MLTNSAFINPDVERLIREVSLENNRFERELRSVQREKIVLPLSMKFLNGEEEIHGFTRNLSAAGACIICQRYFEERTLCKLMIHRLKKSESEVIAECRWCKEFGPDFWMSGWQFLRIPRH